LRIGGVRQGTERCNRNQKGEYSLGHSPKGYTGVCASIVGRCLQSMGRSDGHRCLWIDRWLWIDNEDDT
jgi:hypothetical protein